jgi:hypothetical protein
MLSNRHRVIEPGSCVLLRLRHRARSAAERIASALKKHGGRTILIDPVRIWSEPKNGRDIYGVITATRGETGRECVYETMISRRG